MGARTAIWSYRENYRIPRGEMDIPVCSWSVPIDCELARPSRMLPRVARGLRVWPGWAGFWTRGSTGPQTAISSLKSKIYACSVLVRPSSSQICQSPAPYHPYKPSCSQFRRPIANYFTRQKMRQFATKYSLVEFSLATYMYSLATYSP